MNKCRCYTLFDLKLRKMSVTCPSCKEMEAEIAEPYATVFMRPQLMGDMQNE